MGLPETLPQRRQNATPLLDAAVSVTDEPPTPTLRRSRTLVERLAAFFRAHPDLWIDGRELALVAGAYAWRTRLSELRRPPFVMTIENRQRRIHRPDGSYVVSEYRFVSHDATRQEPR
jgi:hypothetical protein